MEKIITYLNDKELTVKLGKAEQTSECKDPEPAQVKQETKAEGPKQAEKATGAEHAALHKIIRDKARQDTARLEDPP